MLLFCCSDSPVALSHLLIKIRQYLVCRQRRSLGGTVRVTKSDTDNVVLWVGQSVSQSLTLTTSFSGWDSPCYEVWHWQRRSLGGTVFVTKSDTDNVDLWVGQSLLRSLTLTTSISGWDSPCHKVWHWQRQSLGPCHKVWHWQRRSPGGTVLVIKSDTDKIDL